MLSMAPIQHVLKLIRMKQSLVQHDSSLLKATNFNVNNLSVSSITIILVAAITTKLVQNP